MQYAKAHTKLLYIYSLIAIVISLILIEYATPYVIDSYYCHWFVLAIALLLCFSPFGHTKLSAQKNEAPRHKCFAWLCRLWLLQIALFFVFIGITLEFSHWLPMPEPSYPAIISLSLNTFLKQYGLMPWALFALYAAGLGYYSYVRSEDVYFSNLLKPIIKSTPTTLLANVLNMYARSATFSALTTTFAFITLLIASLLTPSSIPLMIGFHVKTMIIIAALVLLGFTPPFKAAVKRLLDRRIPLYISTVSTLFFFAVFIWLLNALFVHLGDKPVQIPSLIQWLENKNPTQLWIIFSAAWWIAWTPLISAHIARLSRGHRIRNMILACLLLPFLFTLTFIEFPRILLTFTEYPKTFSLIALIAFIYLVKILTEKTALPIMIRSYFPKQDEYKRRDHYFYFRKLFQTMIIIIYLFLPAGMAVTVFTTFIMALSFTLQIPVYLVTSLMRFNSKK